MRSMSALLTAMLLLVPAGAGAAIYRWTDAAGVVHFTDQRPDGQRYEEVRLSDDSRPGEPPARRLCREAVRTLELLRRPGAVYRDEAGHWRRHDSAFSRHYTGERRYLGEDERAGLLRRTRNEVRTYCGAALGGGRAAR